MSTDTLRDALRDNRIAAVVNLLRHIAIEYGSHESLRQRIAQVVVPLLKAPAAPIIGWHIRMRGCDGSADWIELGAERPSDVPEGADAVAVVHAGAAQPATAPVDYGTALLAAWDAIRDPGPAGDPVPDPVFAAGFKAGYAAQPAAAPADHVPAGADAATGWEGAEEWMPLAWELCAEEHGEEACRELLFEGGPIPEPWGDRWLKYEGEAKRLIALVRKCTALAASRPAGIETSEADARLIARARDLLSRAYGHTTASDDLLPEQIKRWLADSEAASQPAAAPVVPAGWPTADMTMAFAKVFNVRDQKATFPPAFRAALAAAPAAPVVPQPAAQQGEAVANSSICQRCGKSAGATMPPPGWPRDHLCTCQPAAAPQPVAQEPLHIGACIVGGRLHATVMRREPSGAVTVIATAEMPAASLQNHDYIAEMAAAPAGAVGEPVAPEDWRDKIIADLRAAHDSAVAQIERLTTKIAAMAPQPQKPLDDPRLQELFSSAISGALALGAAGESHPPAGHWLEDWWQRGRDGAAAPQPGARQALSDVEIDAIGNGLNGHQQPISRRERDRLIARAVIRACAADWGVTLAGIGGKGETA